MPLIPSSPEWDAYVSRKRENATAVWGRWRSSGAVVDLLPREVCVSDVIIPRPNHRRQFIVRTGDGRMSSAGYVARRRGRFTYVADDMATLRDWSRFWIVYDEADWVYRHLTPESLHTQTHFVALTEQLADQFWAPAGMDTTDITAWLDLFRLTDTLTSRKTLARKVIGIWESQQPPSLWTWTASATYERLIRARNRTVALRIVRDDDDREAAGRSSVGHYCEPGRFSFTSPVAIPYPRDAYGPQSMVAYDDHTEVVWPFRSRAARGTFCADITLPRVMVTPDIDLPATGFQSSSVKRPMPLDVSILAYG